MTESHLNTIEMHLIDQLNGEPIPDFRSDECTRVMASINALTGSPEGRYYAEQLGCRMLTMTLDRLIAGAKATREIALLRDNKGELC
jgi:hypothetical protein